MRSAALVSVFGLVVLTSCGVTGRAFVDRSIGYAVTRGQVVRVDSLNSEHQDHLSDGVAVRVEEPGCRVSMKLGEPTQLIELKPGSILVLGKTDDWVLQPYDTSGAAAAQGTAPGAVSEAAPDSDATPGSGSRLEYGPPAPTE